jgi:hypothetical protein
MDVEKDMASGDIVFVKTSAFVPFSCEGANGPIDGFKTVGYALVISGLYIHACKYRTIDGECNHPLRNSTKCDVESAVPPSEVSKA